MTPPILRVLIQEKLANDRSPHTHIPRIWGGPRNGENCDGGEETGTKVQGTLQDTPTTRTHPAMSKELLRGLALAAFTVLGTMTYAASAGAVTAITSCPTTLVTFGETYVLTSDPSTNPHGILNSCGTCLVVANDRITIDLAGHTIIGTCGGAGVTDDGERLLTTVKNGHILKFDYGIDLGSSARTIIRNVEASDNAVNGLLLGPRTLVKTCLIERNGLDGINIGAFGQVQDCEINGNGHAAPEFAPGNGIFAGDRALITANKVVGNRTGIVVGELSTVSYNKSSGNAFIGVLAATRSLITGNETNGNGTGITTSGLSSVSRNISNNNIGVGVDASCPSTVTNNKSSGNGSNYTFDGVATPSGDGTPWCQTKNNQ